MNEWKELKIDDLPPDILTGDYEFLLENGETYHKQYRCNMLIDAVNGVKVLYRKPEPKQPTHKEIMTKWWRGNNNRWFNINCYDPDVNSCYRDCFGDWQNKKSFLTRQSADTPPETIA